MSSRPLDDLRVLDFGQYIAGPLVGMMLADLGAEVIRIDPPSGPAWKDTATDMLARGKLSLVLDLKTAGGRETAEQMIARADVTIENFRPGTMARLGLSPQRLHAINPGLISLSLPGFASADAEFDGVAAWEAIIAARTGQFTDMGLNRQLMGINPSFTPLPLASAYAAAFGTMSVLFALHGRATNGGDHIEVPLASALMEGLAYNSEQVEDYPDRYKSPREEELERRRAAGLPMDLSFDALSQLLDPFYRTYRCADDRGFYVVSGSIATHPRRVLETLGLGELADSLPDFSAWLDTRDWPDEWTMRNYPVGRRDRKRIADAMAAAFLTRPAHEWEALFGAAKAPATMQRSTREWLSDPHALAAGLVVEVDDPVRGKMRQMGNVAWVESDADALHKQPAPPPDSARARLAQILTEKPRDTGVPAGTAARGWLDGMRVLDLTNVIAGPTIGATLARFGAQVVSVQPVTPSVDPWNAIVFGLQAHRGKRSILLNLRTARGQEALARLLAQADVVTMNGTDAQREALGIGPERLKAINPRLILVQLDAFGGSLRGPKSDHLGYDDLAQAATGVMIRFGGGLDTPEEHAHLGTIDALSGFCGAAAFGAALHRLDRTGRGGVARASLAACGAMIQTPFMYDFDGRAPFDEPSGREARGDGPFYHGYASSDGWLFFAAPDEGAQALRHVPDLADLAGLAVDRIGAALAARFATRPTAHWVEVMRGSRAAAIPLGSLHATRDAALVRESEGVPDLRNATYCVVRHDRHPMGRWVDLVAPNAIRPARAPITIPGHMPKYGAHTREVLAEVGFSPTEIERMITEGAAGESWSDVFLPE